MAEIRNERTYFCKFTPREMELIDTALNIALNWIGEKKETCQDSVLANLIAEFGNYHGDF
jgi:hypothetical protein